MIRDFGSADKLVNACRKFEEEIDVIYGHYIIDAKSTLGVTSLCGHTVSLEILTNDENVKERFADEIQRLR